jgi:Domain of unknown function (DUF4253)
MLTTAAVNDDKLDHALGELMANAQLVALAGLADVAHDALALLLQPGPWRLPAHGALVHQLQRLLPPVCLMAGQACPAVGEQAAMSPGQLADWAQQEADGQVQSLARASRNQLKPAGADWSSTFLATLADRRGQGADPRPHLAFGAFCIDAEFVLKARVAQRFGRSTAAMDAPSAEDLAALGLPADQVAALLGTLQGAGGIDIAPAAEGIDTLDIARATAAYLQATGFAGGYLEPVFLPCWLLLADEGRDSAAAEVAGAWLRQDGQARARMIDFSTVPSVRRMLCAGTLAPTVQVDAQAARHWRAALDARRPAQVARATPVEHASPATPTREALLLSLQGTPLHALPWLRVPVPGSDEIAWVASIPGADRKHLWQAARARLGNTGRWPLVTTLWSGPVDASDPSPLSDELFGRFPYEQGPARDDVSPRSYIATSQSADPDAMLADLARRDGDGLDEQSRLHIWRDELSRAGVPLDGFDEAWHACGGDRLRFEHWLAQQEALHGVADPALGRQEGFAPDNAWLVLLPTPHSEHALAYLHWYGIDRGTVEGFIRLLRAWREGYAAELFAHYGTMLEFVVQHPPADIEAAFPLARAHELAAPCTTILPGIALRHYALGLVGQGEWFLHERP